jgi:hypothetical protein
VRDLLLCAKHLFVAATVEAQRDLCDEWTFRVWQWRRARWATGDLLLSAGCCRGCRDDRSIQAGTALALGVSQQAFKHATGIRVAGVTAAHVTPVVEVPIDRASFGDHLQRVTGLRGGQSASSERARSAHVLGFVIVSSRLIRSAHSSGTAPPNGQPGHTVVGPGWLQLGVSNRRFVTPGAV